MIESIGGTLLTTVWFVVAIALLIAVHEYGHFLAARKLGVRVEKFSIGFGPKLFSWFSKDGEVEYIIAAIPLGGYIKMLGEATIKKGETLSEDEKKRAFDHQAVWVRAVIASAGPLFNFLFAILVYAMIAWLGQEAPTATIGSIVNDSPAAQAGFQEGDLITAVNDVDIHIWMQFEEQLKKHAGHDVLLDIKRHDNPMRISLYIPLPEQDPLLVNMASDYVGILRGLRVSIDKVLADSAAAAAGMQAGDEFMSIDDVDVNDARAMIKTIAANANTALPVVILRGQQFINLTLTPRANDKGEGKIGVMLSIKPIYPNIIWQQGLFSGLWYGVERTWEMSVLTLDVLVKMVTSVIGAENLGGPIAIAQLAGQTASLGLVPFLMFLGLISVNLGVLNLLPVPILDGGHLAYLSIEAVRGKPLSDKIMEKTQMVGLVLVMSLMTFAVYNDLVRWLQS
ncbi:MAG: RIP metalloprotease RseP [Mariprofundales bacterium]